MDTQNIENTLKKMGLVLEKLVTKVDEIDKRLAKIEEKSEKKFSSEDLKTPQIEQTSNSTSKSSLGGFGSSFLGSLTGAMAGMGLYNLLFNHSVSPVEMGQTLGMDTDEINNILENDLNEINSKLDEIDSKLDELDSRVDEIASNDDVMDNEYYESYDEEVSDNDFDSGFDDFDGLDDFDV